jgi:hypothetical protein
MSAQNYFSNSMDKYKTLVSNINNINLNTDKLNSFLEKNNTLENKLDEQIGELDTKNRRIQLTEKDISFNQEIIRILYIILIGLSIIVVLYGLLFIYRTYKPSSSISSSSTSTSTSSISTDNYFSKMKENGSSIGSYFSNLFGTSKDKASSSSSYSTSDSGRDSSSGSFFSNIFGSKKDKNSNIFNAELVDYSSSGDKYNARLV